MMTTKTQHPQSCSAELSLMSFAWVVYVLMSGSLLYFLENPLLNIAWPNSSYQLIDSTVVINGTSVTVPVPTGMY